MTAPALVAVEDETLEVVAQRMAARGVGSVVVVDAGRPVGILTERDLLRAAAAGAAPSTALVAAWMTAEPDCLDTEATIDEAWAQLGSHGYRHIPVVGPGEDFKGIVSMRDLVTLAQLRPAGEHALVAPPGLKGVVVAETALGDVRGAEGFFHYRQYSAPELAAARSYEDVWQLVFDGELPRTVDDARAFGAEVASARHLPDSLFDLLALIASSSTPMDGLRTAISHLAASTDVPPSLNLEHSLLRADAMRLAASAPTIVGALHRLRSGLAPVAPDDSLGHAANYLYMLTGVRPSPAQARAIEQYLILALDHGFNASTFTARAVTSTGADLGAALCAAIGSLSGPLHGGAVHRALETLDAIGSPARAKEWVREAISQGRTIMGFGHPVYRTADPRSLMLRGVAERLGGPRIELAIEVEVAVEEALAELKPGRELHTNIEWYAAVVMETLGFERDLMAPTFAATRIVGWCAQAMEQAADNRIIRPSARYVGPPPPVPVPSAG
ncbi:MAG: citrate synthase [Actinomycetota bacterium]|nr:citrate synthase [Actinomycetota bacterium]